MKKYLITTLPSNDIGLLTRSLPIARELQNHGHQVAFCSPAKAPTKLISVAGFENFRPSQFPYYFISADFSLEAITRLLYSRHLKRDVGLFFSFIRSMTRSSTAEIWNIDHFMHLMGMWNQTLIRANVETLIEIISAYKPDVIVDFWNPFACIAARVCHRPLVTIIQADMHPQSQGFIWWKPVSGETPSPVPATNTILAEYGLPSINKMGELLIGDMTLVLGMPETDPLPDSANVTYIGPILWQKQDEKLPDWVTQLDRELPIIWLYPGNLQYVRGLHTYGDSEVVLKACIEALGNKAVQVVLTTGYQALLRRFVPLPTNFRHETFVPGLAMAEKSDLLIHHGGYGSCQTGLYTGKPALIIPTYSERESNARRIAAVGAGDYVLPKSDITGTKKVVSAEEVASRVFQILSNSLYGENAKRMGERMRGYGGAIAAAKLIECFDETQVESVG